VSSKQSILPQLSLSQQQIQQLSELHLYPVAQGYVPRKPRLPTKKDLFDMYGAMRRMRFSKTPSEWVDWEITDFNKNMQDF
jgi:hypothetical protein